MTSAVVDVTRIASADWSRQVGALGQVVEQLADIEQAMGIVLATPKGADPHRPTFGCDAWKYLDHPTNSAIPHVIREATEALREWEPRANIVRITATIEASHVIMLVEWSVRLGSTLFSPLRTPFKLERTA